MPKLSNTSRQALLALGAILIAIVALLPAPASASVELQRVAAPQGARAYWTPARMRAAEPVDADAAPALRAGAPGRAAQGGSPSYVPPAAAGREGSAGILAGRAGGSRGVARLSEVRRDEIADPAAREYAAHGKVFFTVGSGPETKKFVCSGTAVNSRNRSLVWTAGHCVFDHEVGIQPGFASRFIFVPGYSEDAAGSKVAPHGEWPAKKLGTTAPFKASGNLRYDLGAAVVMTNAAGQKLQDVVAARGIGFDQPRAQVLEAFGYPVATTAEERILFPGFTGGNEFRCTGPPVGEDRPYGAGPATMEIACDMTKGSSGGGWIAGGNVLVSVTSYGYEGQRDRQYGPYMSSGAKKLYKAIRGKRKPSTRR